jgi:hypothetical protein
MSLAPGCVVQSTYPKSKDWGNGLVLLVGSNYAAGRFYAVVCFSHVGVKRVIQKSLEVISPPAQSWVQNGARRCIEDFMKVLVLPNGVKVNPELKDLVTPMLLEVSQQYRVDDGYSSAIGPAWRDSNGHTIEVTRKGGAFLSRSRRRR